jgi:hypothetical protein
LVIRISGISDLVIPQGSFILFSTIPPAENIKQNAVPFLYPEGNVFIGTAFFIF